MNFFRLPPFARIILNSRQTKENKWRYAYGSRSRRRIRDAREPVLVSGRAEERVNDATQLRLIVQQNARTSPGFLSGARM
jgi:hypothetical protein